MPPAVVIGLWPPAFSSFIVRYFWFPNRAPGPTKKPLNSEDLTIPYYSINLDSWLRSFYAFYDPFNVERK